MKDNYDPAALAKRWQLELSLAKQSDKDWAERSRKIVKRYRDKRDGVSSTERRFNILWSNIRTLLPACYSKVPKAQVSRRYKDADPVARCAATILERSLQFEIDSYGDFDASIRQALLDRLLPGRGVAWVRFEPAEQSEPAMSEEGEPQITDDIETELPFERSPCDYVYWEDFRHSPARTWEEVTWVARRVYMSRAEGKKRFGDAFNDVELTTQPIGLDELRKQGMVGDGDALKKGEVWEIWDKDDKTVCWYAKGHQTTLDCRPDPLNLEGFFPCPKPLFATLTTDTLTPVPDYALYQDQAKEIDMITQRIGLLVKACKVAGVYDASQTGVQRMIEEGTDNILIPVDKWAAFAEKGGVKGTVDFLPLDMIVGALDSLYQARDAAKQVVYEVTGMSDIIRGASVATETATAQQIKSQYASLRLKEMQGDVARFASELLRLKAQIMCDLYSPQTLLAMSGIQGTPDAQFAEPAIQLLKSYPVRTFRIEVAADSLVEIDEDGEKQSRLEFLTAAGGFIKEAVQAAREAPELGPLMGEMLMFGVRSFKAAQPIESAFDTMLQQIQQRPPEQPQPDPEAMKVQAQAQQEQARMQMEQAKFQAEQQATQQLEQFKAQQQQQSEALKAQTDAQLEQLRLQHAASLESQRLDFERWKAELDAQTKVMVAELSSQTTLQTAQMSAAAAATKQEEKAEKAEKPEKPDTAVQDLIKQLIKQHAAPVEIELIRGKDGRAIGGRRVVQKTDSTGAE